MRTDPTATVAGARLLLADDDVDLCAALERALARRGFDVVVAHDYRGALEHAAARPPAFAVVDLKFPGGSGLALVTKLLELRPGMRIVVLTGFASIATAIQAIKLGAHYYLNKPATAEEIVAALDAELRDGAAQLGDKPLSVERLAWEHIQRVLIGNRGNISATARQLGMHRRTLQRKLARSPEKEDRK